MSLKLQDALESLYGLERRRNKLGLDGTRALLAALGEPQRTFRSVHVAGTNGKGSVAALVERVLRTAGIRTGLFTSPHLVDFRERIRVSGRWADEAALAGRLEHLRSLPAGRDRTFFEVATALGFDAFARAEVEWAVVEVGLGGRLDTTNVLEPAATAITAIGLDHTETLGGTLEAIAAEKAGIVKPGVPLIAAAQPPAVAAVLARAAVAAGAPFVSAPGRARVRALVTGPGGSRFETKLAPWGPLSLEIRLAGRHQVENAGVALAVLAELARGGVDLPAAAVREGLARARWPGRLEPCPAEPRLWWDGAHNAAGIARLTRAWSADLGFEPPGAIVLALSRDKDAPAILDGLRALAPRAALVLTRTRNDRALPTATLAAHAGPRAETADDVPGAIRRALARAGDGRVLLTGSLFAVGEAMSAWGGAPGERE